MTYNAVNDPCIVSEYPVTVDSDTEYVYLARKLTPTECASLQGFPKNWCEKVPHTDAKEYKMWGNGMALPCVLYVMEGFEEVLKQRQLQYLFGGENNAER